MRFIVHDEVWQRLDDACFGVVVARGVDNSVRLPGVDSLLEERINLARQQFNGVDVREHAEVVLYRQAFTRLGFNPNKFQCSVEALLRRVTKGGAFPRVNSLVDLVNAVSLKYIVPIGAHDLTDPRECSGEQPLTGGDIEVRFSRHGDIFIPFGADRAELLEPGELVYVRGSQVRTRRWIWRQSEVGKICEACTDAFFPLDGFRANKSVVLAARDELAMMLVEMFGCAVLTDFVDRDHPAAELDKPPEGGR